MKSQPQGGPEGQHSRWKEQQRSRGAKDPGELGEPRGDWGSWSKSRGQARPMVPWTGLMTLARKEGERPGVTERRGWLAWHTLWCLHYSAQAAVTKYNRLAGLNNRNIYIFSHNSGGWKSKLAGLLFWNFSLWLVDSSPLLPVFSHGLPPGTSVS